MWCDKCSKLGRIYHYGVSWGEIRLYDVMSIEIKLYNVKSSFTMLSQVNLMSYTMWSQVNSNYRTIGVEDRWTQAIWCEIKQYDVKKCELKLYDVKSWHTMWNEHELKLYDMKSWNTMWNNVNSSYNYDVKPGELKLYNVKPDELALVYDVKSSYMM